MNLIKELDDGNLDLPHMSNKADVHKFQQN